MNPYKLIIWGPRQSGKTTYLATLIRHLGSLYPVWRIREGNQEARRLSKQAQNMMYTRRIFLPPTQSQVRYQYHIWRQIEGSTYDEVLLQFDDIAGEIYERLWDVDTYDSETTAATEDPHAPTPSSRLMTPAQWFDQISDMDGLLLFLDPHWQNVHRDERTYADLISDFLQKLSVRRQSRGIKRPLYVALCLTKADVHDHHWKVAQKPATDPDQHDAPPAVPTCQGGQQNGLECAEHCPIHQLLGRSRERLPNCLSSEGDMTARERLRCFYLSAIGRNKQNQHNTRASRLWMDQHLPQPPPLIADDVLHSTPSEADVAAFRDKYAKLVATLNQLSQHIKDDDGYNDDAETLSNVSLSRYHPWAIKDAEELQPTNIIAPIEWLLAVIKASDKDITGVIHSDTSE